MFDSARLKLTLWYLLIIMIISLAFSVVIYRLLSIEVVRFARMHRYRLENNICESQPLPPEFFLRHDLPPLRTLEAELVADTKQRLLISLAFLNGGILVVAGTLGYALAGRTLRPIKEMMDDQNRFISDSSHELKTPLTSLKTALEVSLRDPKLNLKETKQLIRESIDEVNKLQVLSESLLQLAAYERPNGYTHLEPIFLPDLIQRAIQKVTPLAKEKHIHIDATKATTTALTLEGHPASLEQLLIILLDNAIKYSPPKTKITLHSLLTHKVIKLSIADQGRGIEKEDLPHIFDRFYRADSARSKTQTSGYGLGLSIAHKIVSIHKGSIKALSEVDKGSTFIVTLPLTH